MRVEALRLANFLHARLVDSTTQAFVFEMTGSTEEIDSFIELMRPLGLGRGIAHRGGRDRPPIRAKRGR